MELTRTQVGFHMPARNASVLGLPEVGVFSVPPCLLFAGGVSPGVLGEPQLYNLPGAGECTGWALLSTVSPLLQCEAWESVIAKP